MPALRTRRIVLVAIIAATLAPLGGCARHKPARELPAIEEVFGHSAVAAQAAAESDTEPSDAATPTPATALTILAATATAMAATPVPTLPMTSTPEVAASASPSIDVGPTATPDTALLTTVIVSEGDTLYSLARRHGTTVEALQAVNALGASDRIEFGQTLYLPADAQVDSGPAVRTTDYWVRQGETLSMIARRYKTSIGEIMAANPAITDEDQIYPGMRIVVPVNTAPQRTHQVRYGESLSGIAARYGVSVRSIVQANGLRNANQIYSGQVLIIPE